jgi:hypothetical protein
VDERIIQPEHETLPCMSEEAAYDLDLLFLETITDAFSAEEVAQWITVFNGIDTITSALRDFLAGEPGE